jgi:hypothetical protein
VVLIYVAIPDGLNPYLGAKDWDVNSIFTSQSEGYSMIQSSRLLGLEGLRDTENMEKALKYFFQNNYIVEPINVAGGAVAKNSEKMALNPAWRETYVHMSILPLNQLMFSKIGDVEKSYEQVQKDTEYLDKLSINSGSYLNEVSQFFKYTVKTSSLTQIQTSCLEPEWQKSLWGSNYGRLLEIKEKYDPNNTLWCTLCVGSDKFQLGADNKLYYPRQE